MDHRWKVESFLPLLHLVVPFLSSIAFILCAFGERCRAPLSYCLRVFFYFYPISIGTLRSRGTTFVYAANGDDNDDRKDFARSILTPCFSPALATATSFLFDAHTHTPFPSLAWFLCSVRFLLLGAAQRFLFPCVAPVLRPLYQTFATGPHWLETEVDDLG